MNLRLLVDSTLIAAAVFYGVLLSLAVAAGLFGIWLGFVLMLSLWRYSYGVLRALAQGRKHLPPEPETLNPIGDWRLVMHFIAFPALVIVLTWVRPFGEQGVALAVSHALALGVVLAIPASVSLMGITSRLEAAFSPLNVVHVINILGKRYYMLVAACVLAWLAAALVSAALPSLGFVTRAIGFSFAAWAVLVTFALTGTLLRDNRNAFDIPGEYETNEELEARWQRSEWRKTLDLAYGSIRSGLVAEGYATLRKLSAQNSDSLEVLYWLFDNMVVWEEPQHALRIAVRIIERHVADGHLTLALDLYDRCRRIHKTFHVPDPAAPALAAFARSIGRAGAADEIAHGGSLGGLGF